MKLLFSLFFIIFSFSCFSQNINNEVYIKKETISSSEVSKKSISNANKFQQQLSANPKNADTWLEYYISVERAKEYSSPQKANLLNSIYNSSGNYIKGSWQYFLVGFIQSGKKDSSSLFAALNLTNNKVLIYPYVIQYAIISHDKELVKKISQELNSAHPISPALFEYHYNTLMSSGKNSIIYAKGLDDIAPMAVLQNVYNLRPDIELRYYDGNVENSGNVYLCLSLGKDIISLYPNSVYSGLLVKLNSSSTSPAVNVQETFKLSALNNAANLTNEEKLIYKNYLPSFILLYNQLKQEKSDKSAEWKIILEKLLIITDMKNSVDKLINE